MTNLKVNVLMVEEDKDRINIIKNFLSKDIYAIESIISLDDALEKILTEGLKIEEGKTREEHDVVFFRIGSSIKEADAEKFLGDLHRIDTPVVIARGKNISTQGIDKILSGKKYEYIQTDCPNPDDELYELENAIMKLVPKAFCCFKSILQGRIVKIEKMEVDYDKIKSDLNKYKDDLENFKIKYVSWDRILEAMSMFVGAFSLAIGIIVSFILLFFDKKGLDFYFGHLLMAFVIVILLCGVLQYIFLKRKIVKMVEEKFGGNIKKKEA